MVWGLTERVGHRFEEGDLPDFRRSHRQMAVELWHEYPVIGGGARTFQYKGLKYKQSEERWTLNLTARHAHCEYYQLLAEYGLIGFGLCHKLVVMYAGKIVEAVIETKVALPPQIEAVMDKEKVAISISSYEDLKVFLIQKNKA